MTDERPCPIETPRPKVLPKPEIWDLCKSLAEKHNLTPFQVLERLVAVGASVAKVEEVGGTVTAAAGAVKADIKIFGKDENGHKPQVPTP